jgi:vancomycin permeability regulator SanA
MLSRRRRWLLAGAAIVAVADIVYVAAFESEVQHFATQQVRADPSNLPAMDAAVVFFESMDGDSLSAGSEARVADALALYRSGRVRALFVVGGRRAGRRPGSVLMAERLAAGGVSPDSIVVDSESFDSRTNWRAARQIARLHAADSLVLVSAPYHLERLVRVAQDSSVTLAFYAQSADRDSDSWGDHWLIAHREGLARAADAVLPRARYDGLVRRMRR